MGSWNAKILTLPLRRWNDDVAARCGFLISSLLRRIQLFTSFWRVVFNNTTPLCTNNNKTNLIPTWKLSRQIATIYLQTTHCQILVLFFLHGIPQKTTLLDFKSNTVLKTALIVVVFRMWAVYDTGTSTHSPSQQKWIPAASLITKNKVGHPVQFILIIRSR